jgi:hypothetical protein
MDVWECDFVDVQTLAKYVSYRYMLTVIDVFSKFLQVPLRAKAGTAVSSGFLSIFKDKEYSKPIRQRPI